MVFISNLLKKLVKSKDDSGKSKKKINPFIQKDTDPFGMWRNVGELGDGAFGKVFKAEHKTNQKVAALKQVEFESDEDLEDLMVEIDILTLCKHQNIVDLFEAYLHEGKIWMYIEFCGGGAIDSLMMELEKPLTEPQIRYVAHEMCAALNFLHSHYIIHRDLKAGNVLLTLEGRVKLADFGVSAKNRDDKQKRDTYIGTPYWMAPEVIACEMFKDQPYDEMADIWSLAITLIEFAEMKPPNSEMHPMRVGIKIQKSEPPKLRRGTEWSPEFHAFLKKCLWKLPQARSTAEQLLLEPFIKDVRVEDNLPIRQLISEAKAEVIETVEDMDPSMRNSITSIDSSESDAITTDDEGKPQPFVHFDVSEVSDDDLQTMVSDIVALVIEATDVEEQSLVSVVLETKQELLDEIYATVEISVPSPSAEIAAVINQVDAGPSSVSASSTEPNILGVVKEDDEDGAAKGREAEDEGLPNGERAEGGEAQTATDLVDDRPKEEGQDKEDAEEEAGESKSKENDEDSRAGEGLKNGELRVEDKDIDDDEVQEQELLDEDEERREAERTLEEEKEKTQEEEKEVDETEEKDRDVEEEEKDRDVEEEKAAEAKEKEEEKEVKEVKEAEKKEEEEKEKEEEEVKEADKKEEEEKEKEEEEEVKEAETKEEEEEGLKDGATEDVKEEELNEKEKAAEAKESEEEEEEVKEAEKKEEEEIKEAEKKKEEEEEGEKEMKEAEKEEEEKEMKEAEKEDEVKEAEKEEEEEEMKEAEKEEEVKETKKEKEEVKEAEKKEEEKEEERINIEKKGDKKGKEDGKGDMEEEDEEERGQRKTEEVTDLDDGGGSPADADQKAAPGPQGDAVSSQPSIRVPADDTKEKPTVERKDLDAVVRRRPQKNDTTKRQCRTLKRVRKFTIDGQEYTTTTKRKVTDSRDDMKRHREYLNRKMAMREVKRLQIMEQRENRELLARQDLQRDELDVRLKQEELTLRRNQEQELDSLQRHHRTLLDRAEADHSSQLKVSTRRIRSDQDREKRRFHESLKTEKKVLKHEVDNLPKAQRKEEFRRRMDTKDEEFTSREKKFMDDQQNQMKNELSRLQVKFAEAIDTLEEECLQECHEKRKQHDDSRGELQLRHLQMRHTQIREHQQELYRLKRQQNVRRQELERTLLQRSLTKEEAELKAAQTDDLKQLPKLKARDMKVRQEIFRQSLLIPGRTCTPEEERDRIRAFEDSERERVKSEIESQERRYQRRLQALALHHQLHLTELQEIHAEKQKQLLDQETLKMTELQETCRKQVEAKKEDITSLHKFLLRELSMESKNKGSNIRQRSNSCASIRSFRGSIFS